MIWSVYWESGCVLWGVYTIRSILDHGDTNILFSSRVVKIKENSNRKFNSSLHQRISDNQTNAGGSPWELPSLRRARILTTGWRLPIKPLDYDVNKKKYPETCARHNRDSTLFKDHSVSTPQHGGCGLAHATWGLQSARLHPCFTPALGDFLQIFTKHVAYRTLKGFRGGKNPSVFNFWRIINFKVWRNVALLSLEMPGAFAYPYHSTKQPPAETNDYCLGGERMAFDLLTYWKLLKGKPSASWGTKTDYITPC